MQNILEHFLIFYKGQEFRRIFRNILNNLESLNSNFYVLKKTFFYKTLNDLFVLLYLCLQNEEMYTEGELRGNLEDSERVRELQDKIAELEAEVIFKLNSLFFKFNLFFNVLP